MDKENLALGDIIVVEEGKSAWIGVVFSQEADGTPIIARWDFVNGVTVAAEELVFGDKPVIDNIAEAWRQSQELFTRNTRTLASIVDNIYELRHNIKKGSVKQLMSNLKMYRVDIDWEPR